MQSEVVARLLRQKAHERAPLRWSAFLLGQIDPLRHWDTVLSHTDRSDAGTLCGSRAHGTREWRGWDKPGTRARQHSMNQKP